MARAYISLGSNLGNREQNLREALRRLAEADGLEVVASSTFHETAAVGPPQPDYLNAAAELATDLAPDDLLRLLQQIENDLGRVRTVKWGPRTIDLDVLLYDDQVIDAPVLKVPHPHMHEREFVLAPLLEIAADVIVPRLGLSVRKLLDQVRSPAD
jgi:2-amino-4-hydroxy-6-hydroxymethyldihydropteridine diphosphokinase